MKPDTNRPDGIALSTFQAYLYTVVTTANGTQPWVALRAFQAYLYTVVTIANGAQPHTVEAELWWNRPVDKDGDRWHYFRRYVDKSAEDAVRGVERDFKVWAEGQREAEGPSPNGGVACTSSAYNTPSRLATARKGRAAREQHTDGLAPYAREVKNRLPSRDR